MQSANIITDIDRCREVWHRFSPRKSLYDLWEFRLPFWEVCGFEPAFVCLENKGMLPLWYQPDQRKYLWFGDLGDTFDWQEDTAIWAEDAEAIKALLDSAPRPLRLTCLTSSAAEIMRTMHPVEQANNKCVLDLKNIRSTEDYLAGLPKKLRSNLRRDDRRINALAPQFSDDGPDSLETLLAMNKRAFPDSPFYNEKLCQIFRKIAANALPDSFIVSPLTARIDGEIAAVDFILRWNKTMYALLTGADKVAFPGIGHAMNLKDIAIAVDDGMESIDFAEADPGALKEKLFTIVPQYHCELP